MADLRFATTYIDLTLRGNQFDAQIRAKVQQLNQLRDSARTYANYMAGAGQRMAAKAFGSIMQTDAAAARGQVFNARAQLAALQTPAGKQAYQEQIKANQELAAVAREIRRAQMVAQYGAGGAKARMVIDDMAAAFKPVSLGIAAAVAGLYSFTAGLKTSEAAGGWFRVMTASIGRDLTPALALLAVGARQLTAWWNSLSQTTRSIAAPIIVAATALGTLAVAAGIAAIGLRALGIGGAAATAAAAAAAAGGGRGGMGVPGAPGTPGSGTPAGGGAGGAASKAGWLKWAGAALLSGGKKAISLFKNPYVLAGTAAAYAGYKAYEWMKGDKESQTPLSKLPVAGTPASTRPVAGTPVAQLPAASSRLPAAVQEAKASQPVSAASAGAAAAGSRGGFSNTAGKPVGPPAQFMQPEDVWRQLQMASVNSEPWEAELLRINKDAYAEMSRLTNNSDGVLDVLRRILDKQGVK